MKLVQCMVFMVGAISYSTLTMAPEKGKLQDRFWFVDFFYDKKAEDLALPNIKESHDHKPGNNRKIFKLNSLEDCFKAILSIMLVTKEYSYKVVIISFEDHLEGCTEGLSTLLAPFEQHEDFKDVRFVINPVSL